MRTMLLAAAILLTGCSTLKDPPSETSEDLIPKPVVWTTEKREGVAALLLKMDSYLREAATAPLTLTRSEVVMNLEQMEEHLRLRFSNIDARDSLSSAD